MATVHSLRRHRFTLRMVAQAEREGLVDVDLITGRVVVRPIHKATGSAADQAESR